MTWPSDPSFAGQLNQNPHWGGNGHSGIDAAHLLIESLTDQAT